MKLTIIPDDSFVSVDGDSSHHPLDLTSCNIPDNVHALQWFDTKGWIEFDDPVDPFAPKQPNEIIEVLPNWAESCVSVWMQWTPPVIVEPVVEETPIIEETPVVEENSVVEPSQPSEESQPTTSETVVEEQTTPTP